MQRRQFLKTAAAGVTGMSAMSALVLSACDRQAAATAAPALSSPPQASTPTGETPKVIRVGAMGFWGTPVAADIMGILQSQKLLEKEFEKDGTRIEWNVMDGAGPAQNEAIASGLIDFGHYGALPNIIGKARGLKTRILASYGYVNSYLAVRTALPVKSPADLKGYRLAADIGHINHLTTAMLLKQFNIDLKDVTLVKLGDTEALAALAAGQVDAYLGGMSLFALEDQGIVRIVYSARGDQSHASNFGGFVAVEQFAGRYPEATRRVLKSYLRATQWIAEPGNREAYFDWVTKNSTTPLRMVQRDFDGQALSTRVNPVISDDYLSRYREGIAFCLKNDLIRSPVDVDHWIDRDANESVIAELGLQQLWGDSKKIASAGSVVSAASFVSSDIGRSV
jgi:sulfonate transport system substrate-binding protein